MSKAALATVPLLAVLGVVVWFLFCWDFWFGFAFWLVVVSFFPSFSLVGLKTRTALFHVDIATHLEPDLLL